LGKVALKHDLKSYICWHVYGLLYRSAKHFDEAVKAYKYALKLEPESAQILRDLAFLQVHIRDYPGYIESRKLMLQAKPYIRQNWTALAVAYHLGGFPESAENILRKFEDTLKQPPPRSDTEHSELAYYRNGIIEETGDFQRALEHLESVYTTNLDRTGVMEARARLLLKLNRHSDAEKAYRALIQRNNEYRLYYESLETALQLDRSKEEDHPKLAKLYEAFIAENDKVDAARRIPLDFLQGEFMAAKGCSLTCRRRRVPRGSR
jgi:peptide alpha-N-acetyltransferase